MTNPLCPARETRLYVDTDTVPGYIVTATACWWTHDLWEAPHFRIEVSRADGGTLWVETLPAGTSPKDAEAVGLMLLRVNAAGDVRQMGRAA